MRTQPISQSVIQTRLPAGSRAPERLNNVRVQTNVHVLLRLGDGQAAPSRGVDRSVLQSTMNALDDWISFPSSI
jgi:hypothetical protein